MTRNSLSLLLAVCVATACTVLEPEGGQIHLRIFNNSDVKLENISVAGSPFKDLEPGEVSAFRTYEKLYSGPGFKFDFGTHSFAVIPVDHIGDTPLPEGAYTLLVSAEEEYGGVYFELMEGGVPLGEESQGAAEKLIATRVGFDVTASDVATDGSAIIVGNRITERVLNPTVTDNPDSKKRYLARAITRVTKDEEWLLKLDPQGEIVWSRPLEQPHAFRENKRVVRVEEGGFMILGSEARVDPVDGPVGGVYLLNYDDAGILNWSRQVTESRLVMASAIVSSRQGGFLLSGLLDGQTWVASVDGAGSLRWETVLQQGFYGESIVESDDGIVVAGGRFGDVSRESSSGMAQLDLHGNQAGHTALDHALWSVVQAEGGSYFVSGTANYRAAVLFKLSSTGALLWKRVLPETDRGYTMTQIGEGDLVLLGAAGQRPAMFRIDQDGEELWRYVFNIEQPGTLYPGNTLDATPDGGLLFLGSSFEGIYLAKVDPEGNLLFERQIVVGRV